MNSKSSVENLSTVEFSKITSTPKKNSNPIIVVENSENGLMYESISKNSAAQSQLGGSKKSKHRKSATMDFSIEAWEKGKLAFWIFLKFLAKTLDWSPKFVRSEVDSGNQSRALELIRKEKELIEFWK